MSLERVRRDVEIISHAGLDTSTLVAEFDESIQRAVPHILRSVAGARPQCIEFATSHVLDR